MANIYDDIDPTFLSLALRALITRPDEDREQNRISLQRWFPISGTFLPGLDWEFDDKASLRTYTEAMPARALDTAVRLKGREGFQRKSGQMAAWGEGYLIREHDMVRQAAVAADSAAKAARLTEVFDDIARGFRAFNARMEILYAEIIRLGTMTIAENGVQPTPTNFGRAAGNTHTVAVAWSNAATADPFTEEETALDVLKDEQDLDPEDLVVLTNRATYREWAATDAVRESLQTVRVHDRLSDAELATIRRDHGLPPIVIYNRSARAYGASSGSKLFPDGDWIYAPANTPLGATQLGTPPSADMPGVDVRSGAGNGPVAYIEYETNPAQMRTILDLIGAPVEYDPNATYRMVV